MSNNFAARLARAVLASQGISDPDVTTLRRLELDIRRQFGGERWYVGKADSMGKVERLGSAIASGASPAEAISQAEVSRQWGYKLMRRVWR
jgi:Mor family transcriptional regulator